jgi:hypothetical protein
MRTTSGGGAILHDSEDAVRVAFGDEQPNTNWYLIACSV